MKSPCFLLQKCNLFIPSFHEGCPSYGTLRNIKFHTCSIFLGSFFALLDPDQNQRGSGSTTPVPEFIDPVFGHENDRFRENKSKMLIFNPIRTGTQGRWYQLVLDEIIFGGSFQILKLRRGRDQLVFTGGRGQEQPSCLPKS